MKKENIFVRLWKKLCKLCSDTVGELKKVVWTPKNELIKSTQLVVVSVIAVSVTIALVDLGVSFVINSLAQLVG